MTALFQQLPVLVVALPLLCVPLLYFADHALGLPTRATAVFLYVAASAVTLVAVTVPAAEVVTGVGGWHADLGIELTIDPLARMFLPLIAGIGLLGLIAARPGGSPATYYTLMFLLLAGSNGIVVTRDLFNAYVFVEITSIASYALVSYRQERRGFESAFKYVIVGSVASLLLLWGIAGLYVSTGTLSITAVSSRLTSAPPRLASASAALVLTGLLVKLGIVPFHAWKPDALAGAPHAVAATLTGATVTAFLALFVRVYTALLAPAADGSSLPALPATTVMAVFACLSILTGHLMALRQTRMSRLLAYSSVAHFGYILGGIAVGSPTALAAALLHAIHHGVMKPGLFFFALAAGADSRDDRISRLSCNGKASRFSIFSFVFLSMGMIGIPPAAGFASKWLLIVEIARTPSAALGTVPGFMPATLAILIALGGAIALLYYLRIARFMIGLESVPGNSEPAAHGSLQNDTASRHLGVLGVCVAYVLVAFWVTDILGDLALAAATARVLEL